MTSPSRQDVHLPVGVRVLFAGETPSDDPLQYYVGPAGPRGDVGPRGPQGDVGPTGPRGYVGDSGPASNAIVFGKQAPTDADGNDQDLFLDLSSYTLYGPKADGAWPDVGQVLIGAQGERGFQGLTGASILVGMDAPQNGTGNDGDVYIANDAQLYGPKSSGEWPSGTVNLRGVQGEVGPQGEQGEASQVPGPQGEKGDRGDVGPVSDVPGPKGDQGVPGADSKVPGPQGEVGPAGSAGRDGTLWFQGDGPPASDNDYPAGSYYYDFTNQTIYPPSEM